MVGQIIFLILVAFGSVILNIYLIIKVIFLEQRLNRSIYIPNRNASEILEDDEEDDEDELLEVALRINTYKGIVAETQWHLDNNITSLNGKERGREYFETIIRRGEDSIEMEMASLEGLFEMYQKAGKVRFESIEEILTNYHAQYKRPIEEYIENQMKYIRGDKKPRKPYKKKPSK